MGIAKIKINPEKEYDTLRQEILKRVEMQNTLINLILTIVAVFLGLGLTNNLISFLIPPIICLMSFIYKTQSLGIIKISNYLIERYEVNDNENWETYNKAKSTTSRYKRKVFLLSLGPVGVFTFLSFISIVIGLFKFKSSNIEIFLLVLDIIIFFVTMFVFYFYSSDRIRKF